MSKWLLVVLVIALAGLGYLFYANQTAVDVPDNYYLALTPADVNSPLEIVRFAQSIQPYAADFSIPERAAFYEWYFNNHGFNISFVYADNFDSTNKSHVWLLARTQMGENIFIEPSSTEMNAGSLTPLTPEYKSYQREFKDIYDLSKNTGGSGKYAWWSEPSGKRILQENILLLTRDQMRNTSQK